MFAWTFEDFNKSTLNIDIVIFWNLYRYKGCVSDSVLLRILCRKYHMIRNSRFWLTSPVNLMFSDAPRSIPTVKLFHVCEHAVSCTQNHYFWQLNCSPWPNLKKHTKWIFNMFVVVSCTHCNLFVPSVSVWVDPFTHSCCLPLWLLFLTHKCGVFHNHQNILHDIRFMTSTHT